MSTNTFSVTKCTPIASGSDWPVRVLRKREQKKYGKYCRYHSRKKLQLSRINIAALLFATRAARARCETCQRRQSRVPEFVVWQQDVRARRITSRRHTIRPALVCRRPFLSKSFAIFSSLAEAQCALLRQLFRKIRDNAKAYAQAISSVCFDLLPGSQCGHTKTIR